MSANWTLLLLAGLFEVAGAAGMKWSQLTHSQWVLGATGLAMIGSLGFLTLALRTLPLGTSYAMWTGMGVVGTTAIGMLCLGEACTPWRLFFLFSILTGLVGLKLTTAS